MEYKVIIFRYLYNSVHLVKIIQLLLQLLKYIYYIFFLLIKRLVITVILRVYTNSHANIFLCVMRRFNITFMICVWSTYMLTLFKIMAPLSLR